MAASGGSLLQKIGRYCAYQERSHREVREKLFELGALRKEVDEIVVRLINEGYLNESRFARAFAGGKFRMKKWGRLKIRQELELHGLTERCIREGLGEIDPKDYLKVLRTILKRKLKEAPGENLYALRHKVSRYAISRGYEPDLVWEALKELTPS
jgi:regulatory protein